MGKDGQTDMTKLIGVFRDYENASKNNIVGLDLTCIRNRRSATFVGNTYMKGLASTPNLYGETCGLVPGGRILHSFRRKPLNKRKQRPRPLADDTIQSIQSFQVITMASALRRNYRRQESWVMIFHASA